MAKQHNVNYTEKKLLPGVRILFSSKKSYSNMGDWWRILEVDYDRHEMLIISEKVTYPSRYNERYIDTSWENCTLRKWLNNEYIEWNFREEEIEAITTSHLQNKDNPEYKTNGGNDTEDKVFLLSLEEVQKYFKDDEDRAMGEFWWLRSPGESAHNAAHIFRGGRICFSGDRVNKHCLVRPALRVDLNSFIFKSLITKYESDEIWMRVPELILWKDTLEDVSLSCENAIIPENVNEIKENCFKDHHILKSVTFPSALKKIGNEAFSGCDQLETIKGSFAQVSYGKGVFDGCEQFVLLPEMYHTTGKLSDDFTRHLDVCGVEELAWLQMYQKGKVWETALSEKISEDNISEIMKAMIRYISSMKKNYKKPAGNCAAFAKANITLLETDLLKELIEVMQEKKLTEFVDLLTADPTAETSAEEQNNENASYVKIIPDGSKLNGNIKKFSRYAMAKLMKECPQDAEVGNDESLNKKVFPVIGYLTGNRGSSVRNEIVEQMHVNDPLILKANWNSDVFSPVAIEVYNSQMQFLGYLHEYNSAGLETIADLIEQNKITAFVKSIQMSPEHNKKIKPADMGIWIEVNQPTVTYKTKTTKHRSYVTYRSLESSYQIEKEIKSKDAYFVKTVFRGFRKQIEEVIKYINKIQSCTYQVNRTHTPDIYELHISENDIVKKILVEYPALKMVSFYYDLVKCYVVLSQPGYGHLTDISFISYIDPKNECFYITDYEPTDNFRGRITFSSSGEYTRVNYEFPFADQWKRFNYLFQDSDRYLTATEIYLPGDIYELEDEAYLYNNDLRKIVLPESIKMIGKNAFLGCNNLQIYVSEEEHKNEMMDKQK